MDLDPTLDPEQALRTAVDLAGGQTALARICGNGVKQANVWGWLNKSRRIPAEYGIPIERALGGKVTRYQLRPDVFGPAAPAGQLSESAQGEPS